MLALLIRNKCGFLDGTISEPKATDSLHITWKRCNDLIVAIYFSADRLYSILHELCIVDLGHFKEEFLAAK